MSVKLLHSSSILHLFFLLIISAIPQSSCQFGSSPRNIETFYPFPFNTPTPPPSPNSSTPNPPEVSPPPSQQQLPTATSRGSSSSKRAVGTAIGITAASTLILSGLFFFFLQLRRSRRKRDRIGENPYNNPYDGGGGGGGVGGGTPVVAIPQNEFMKFNGNLKGVIVDEDGLDVLYWRKLEGEDAKENFEKQVFNNIIRHEEKEEEKQMIRSEPIHEIPLLRGKSSTSQSSIWNDIPAENQARVAAKSSGANSFKAIGKQNSSIQLGTRSPPSPPPPPPPPPVASLAIGAVAKGPSPPPPPAAAAAPPPVQPNKGPPPPPLPKTAGSVASSSKPPPPVPKGESETGNGDGQVKLKPLHWDKVNPNAADHSMVWDKIDGGSFKFDDDLMEALFGYVATNRKSPRSNAATPKGGDNNRSGPPSQIFLLDTRKSQNTAIVLKSLALSRKDIIDALIQGRGLNADILEKLTKVAPSKEEESEILAFDGDPTRLADAESFLYHLLRAVPSAFTRFDAMLFRCNYDHEIIHLKESFQTLEFGCRELRARGLLLKLLEAILKAGNRMNAGTSRGNAQAFKLTALRKLSDVKSTDGKTTLLHFVVEEVVRAEGKRCVLNRNRSMSRSHSHSSSNYGSSAGPENSQSSDDREKEYIMLGLPIVGGLSSEFSNVKKAASVDYDALDRTSKALTTQIAEVRKLLLQCDAGEGGFSKEMKIFLGAAEKETKILREEQSRVMDIVKRTTDYYQAGASNDKNWQPLQLFVIVKDFLEMVDRACVDIARNIQRRKPSSTTGTAGPSSSPGSPKTRPSIKFPKLPPNFMSEQNKNSSNDSSDEDP